MTHRDRLFLCLLSVGILSLGPVLGEGPTLPDLFQKGKTEFKLGSYDSSLKTFNLLDELSRRPGFEAERHKLGPVIAFYRGANLAALGDAVSAKKEFRAYLMSSPSVRLDPGVFPQAVIRAFESARAEAQKGINSGSSAPQGGIVEAYSHFRAAATTASVRSDETWASSPVRYFLTKTEKTDWSRIVDPVERAAFVTDFWQKRDPDRMTPENEFRDEFERRVQFSDTMFTVGEKKGSDTDRGMVFILLGPPSYAGSAILKSDDDPLLAARAAPVPKFATGPGGTTVIEYVPRSPLNAEVILGTREVWHYRRDRLPKSIQLNELDFEFVTKAGYGEGVLQRDPRILEALDKVKAGKVETLN